MPDADLHPNRRLHYWHTGVAQWHEHSQWDFHRPCNCEGQLPNSPEFLMGFFDCLNFIIESTLYALSWSLGFHYNLFMCLFPWCKREITYWVHSFSCPALNAEGQRKKKSGPRHMNMKPQHWQHGEEMFFISFPISVGFQGPSWCWFRCGMAAKRLWPVLGEHVWYSPSCSSSQSWQALLGPLAEAVLQCGCWQAVPVGWLEDTVRTEPVDVLELLILVCILGQKYISSCKPTVCG